VEPEDVSTAVAEAWNRADHDAFLALMHADAEAYLPRSVLEGGPPYRGLAGAAQLWADAFEVWQRFELESREVKDVGGVLILAWRVHCIPRGEGPPVDYDGYWVTELREGKISYWRPYLDRAEAFDAAETRAAAEKGRSRT
jgi:ketosteroid isomerase-like protein